MMDRGILGKEFGRVLLTPDVDELTFVNLNVDVEKVVCRVERRDRVGRCM